MVSWIGRQYLFLTYTHRSLFLGPTSASIDVMPEFIPISQGDFPSWSPSGAFCSFLTSISPIFHQLSGTRHQPYELDWLEYDDWPIEVLVRRLCLLNPGLGDILVGYQSIKFTTMLCIVLQGVGWGKQHFGLKLDPLELLGLLGEPASCDRAFRLLNTSQEICFKGKLSFPTNCAKLTMSNLGWLI